MTATLLQVENLQTAFDTEYGEQTCIEDVSFIIHKGENLAIVGESGCGKSVTALSIMHLLGNRGKIKQGNIIFDGYNLTDASERTMEEIRGNRLSMIFQEPMTSLNPVLHIGFQIREVLRLHTGNTNRQNKEQVLHLLCQVGIPEPKKVVKMYPHELSGGMRQRVMIAMALACRPKLLIADEPTTALDVTIQAQVLELLKSLRNEFGTTVMMITHDLGVVAEIADNVAVMYAGQVVEQADVFSLFDNPQHPYTRGLFQSIPHIDTKAGARLVAIPGMVPANYGKKQGCRFYDRCSLATEQCRLENPALIKTGGDHLVRCIRARSLGGVL